MKLFFSCFLFLTISSAREVILVTYNEGASRATLVKELIENRIGIPKDLISLRKEKKPCQKDDEAIVHLCINNKLEMKALHINRNVILGTLSIFKKDKL